MDTFSHSVEKTWQLAQFHLHWNNVSANGSEHTINGTTYPGEV